MNYRFLLSILIVGLSFTVYAQTKKAETIEDDDFQAAWEAGFKEREQTPIDDIERGEVEKALGNEDYYFQDTRVRSPRITKIKRSYKEIQGNFWLNGYHVWTRRDLCVIYMPNKKARDLAEEQEWEEEHMKRELLVKQGVEEALQMEKEGEDLKVLKKQCDEETELARKMKKQLELSALNGIPAGGGGMMSLPGTPACDRFREEKREDAKKIARSKEPATNVQPKREFKPDLNITVSCVPRVKKTLVKDAAPTSSPTININRPEVTNLGWPAYPYPAAPGDQ